MVFIGLSLALAPAAGNSNSERSYSFTDNDPVQNNYYRIAEYDLDGKSQFTSIRASNLQYNKYVQPMA